MGTIKILDWCKGNSNPKPHWEVRAHSVVTTFFPSHFFATGKTLEEEKVAPVRAESLEIEILNLLQNGPLSRSELTKNLGHKQISGGLKKALSALLQKEVIAFTLPGQPQNKLQKYQIKRP